MIRRTLLILFAVAAVASVAPRDATAQLTPADSAAVVLATARAFEADGEWDVAEALYRYLLERWPGSPAAAGARTALSSVGPSVSGSGATELQVWSTLYGLWLGVAIPGALGAEGSEAYGAGLLLGGPLGFAVGRSVARNTGITLGQARAVTLGGTWGTWQGAGWRDVLDLGEGFHCIEDDVCYGGDTEEETFASMLVGGITGIAIGALLARRGVTDAGATAANTGALWGTWFGFAAGYLADAEDDALLATTLIGGNAGLAAAGLAAGGLGWSRDRWRIVSIVGLLGGLGGVGIDLLLQPDNEKVALAIPLATSIAGLAVGVTTTRDMRPARQEAAPGGALLNLAEGRLSVGGALPLPVLRRSVDGQRVGVGLHLPLFHAALR